jgi:hypothetical protein
MIMNIAIAPRVEKLSANAGSTHRFFSTSRAPVWYFCVYHETKMYPFQKTGCDYKPSMVNVRHGGRGQRIHLRSFGRSHHPLQRNNPLILWG